MTSNTEKSHANDSRYTSTYEDVVNPQPHRTPIAVANPWDRDAVTDLIWRFTLSGGFEVSREEVAENSRDQIDHILATLTDDDDEGNGDGTVES